MGEARGIEVETRDEKSEAEKEELATTGGRSLSFPVGLARDRAGFIF